MISKYLAWIRCDQSEGGGFSAPTPIGDYMVFELGNESGGFVAELWGGPEKQPTTFNLPVDGVNEDAAKRVCQEHFSSLLKECGIARRDKLVAAEALRSTRDDQPDGGDLMLDDSIYTYAADQMPTCPKCGTGRVNPGDLVADEDMDEDRQWVGRCWNPSCQFVGVFEADIENEDNDQ
jgi:hypothetical protein